MARPDIVELIRETIGQNVAVLNESKTEIEMLRGEVKAMHRTLRSHVIKRVDRPAYGIGTYHWGFGCLVCDSRWAKEQPETHKPGCRANAGE